MFRGNLTGRGRPGSAGMGFRGSSPPYPYVGRGRGGLPRCQYPGAIPNMAHMTREQELDLLKVQAGEIKKDLDGVESRIRELEKNKKE